MENPILEIQMRILDIEKNMAVIMSRLQPEPKAAPVVTKGPRELRVESPGLIHNKLGEPYSIKLVYPSFYDSLDVRIPYCTIGFPSGKARLAKSVEGGALFFIYVTSPAKRVIGLTEALGTVEYRGDVDPARPWIITLQWVLGPKADGILLAEAGISVRSRPGDSVWGISPEAGTSLIEKLETLPDLTEEGVHKARQIAGRM